MKQNIERIKNEIVDFVKLFVELVIEIYIAGAIYEGLDFYIVDDVAEYMFQVMIVTVLIVVVKYFKKGIMAKE